eukprot:g2276.t1
MKLLLIVGAFALAAAEEGTAPTMNFEDDHGSCTLSKNPDNELESSCEISSPGGDLRADVDYLLDKMGTVTKDLSDVKTKVATMEDGIHSTLCPDVVVSPTRLLNIDGGRLHGDGFCRYDCATGHHDSNNNGHCVRCLSRCDAGYKLTGRCTTDTSTTCEIDPHWCPADIPGDFLELEGANKFSSTADKRTMHHEIRITCEDPERHATITCSKDRKWELEGACIGAQYPAVFKQAFIHVNAESYDGHRTWTDLSGNGRHAYVSKGHVHKAEARGYGARATVPYIYGNTGAGLRWHHYGTVPSSFTVCSVSRYNNGRRGRIIGARGANWLHGHWAGHAGVAYYSGWKTYHHYNQGNNWLVLCGKNDHSRHNQMISNGRRHINNGHSGGRGHLELTVNDGNHRGESSDWAIMEMAVWNRHLSLQEMYSVVDFFDGVLMDGYVTDPNVKRYDFDDNKQHGFSCGAITSCGHFGKICGGFMTKGNCGSRHGQTHGCGKDREHATVRKQWKSYDAGNYRITLDFIMVDSWDNERATIKVNGRECWNSGPLHFHHQSSAVCGRGNYNDRKVTATCDFALSSKGDINFEVEGHTDQTSYDESYGIDNVELVKLGQEVSYSFDDNDQHGFSCGAITSCGSFGKICGGFMTKGNCRSGHGQTHACGKDREHAFIRKQFNNYPAGNYQIQLDFIMVDSWDNERATIKVNGRECWNSGPLHFGHHSSAVCG